MSSLSTPFQNALEAVEALPIDDQVMLLDVLQKRLAHDRREQICRDIAEAEQDYEQGNVKRGSVQDLMAELDG
jgi:hypothetical protein